MTGKLKYAYITEFEKDLKKLLKRYDTLGEDIENAKKRAIELYHLHGIDNQSVFYESGFYHKVWEIYKLKKFACRSLKGTGVQSGIRIIYAYSSTDHEVVFIEIYHKSDKENEDRERIKEFIKNIKEE